MSRGCWVSYLLDTASGTASYFAKEFPAYKKMDSILRQALANRREVCGSLGSRVPEI